MAKKTLASKLLAAGCIVAAAAAALAPASSAEATPHPAPTNPGDPLPGLSPEVAALFADGSAVWTHDFTLEEGLGPTYNDTSCQNCHGGKGNALGGPDPLGLGSPNNVTHFGRDQDGYFDPLRYLGGPIIQKKSIKDNGAPDCPIEGETVPAIANIRSTRHSPAVWGFGLIDAIPDATILAHENLGKDGIHGFANWGVEMQGVDTEPTPFFPQIPIVGAPRVGRFGWKAQTATLQQFSADPFDIELGVTNQYFTQENTPTGVKLAASLPPACNLATSAPNDPDQSLSMKLYHFQALLAPPPRLPMNGFARTGEALFDVIGCDGCHVPAMRTAKRYELALADGSTVRVPQLEDKRVELYSDLLVHDMGDALADDAGTTVGRVMGRARGNHWRTTPLWGMRYKTALLHDGRTADPRAAILLHGGEATIVRNRFAALPPVAQNAIVAFLRTL